MISSHGYIAGSCGHRVDPFNMESCVWGLSMEVEPGFQRLRTIQVCMASMLPTPVMFSFPRWQRSETRYPRHVAEESFGNTLFPV